MMDARLLAPALLALGACGKPTQEVEPHEVQLDRLDFQANTLPTEASHELPEGYTIKDGPIRLITDWDIVPNPDPKLAYFTTYDADVPVVCGPFVDIYRKVSAAEFMEKFDAQMRDNKSKKLDNLAFYLEAEGRNVIRAVSIKTEFYTEGEGLAGMIDTQKTILRRLEETVFDKTPVKGEDPNRISYSIQVHFPKGYLSYEADDDPALLALAVELHNQK